MFDALVKSTSDFYKRFNRKPTLTEAQRIFLEEVGEFLEAVAESDSFHIAEEAADVIVTIIGMLTAAGVTLQEFEAAMGYVATKNELKTHETHEYRDGKIRKK